MSSSNQLKAAVESLFQEAYPADGPGATLIIVKAGQVLHRTAIGLAHLELGVPMKPDMVFRLGSITKQVTGVAILMLMEQGRLALSDPITKFFPDYPTHAHTITIEHLLTHTSGICSYTDMPAWSDVWRKDFTVAELIDFFKYQPMQFAPGTRWAYNNSGYFLLGAIIEQISGQSYAQFLQQQIFEPLGMAHSFYDTTQQIIPGRVAGYAKGPDGYANAEYLSMTQPHAAGGLISTVDDLSIWDSALTNNRLLKAETIQQAWAAYTLADGSSTNYGYGWSLSGWQGRKTIEHGGGIHGFSTYALRMLEEQLYVAILSNIANGPPLELLTLKIAGLAIGAPFVAPVAIQLEAEQLSAFAGVYQLPHEQQWAITLEGNQLIGQRSGWQPIKLIPITKTTFYVAEMPLYQLIFTQDAPQKRSALQVHGREGIVETGLRSE